MGAAPHAPIQPVDATVVRGSGSSCGVAKERMDNQSENQYCLDWFMCFRKESKYCYVSLDTDSAQENPVVCLSGLQLQQKETLWRLFLEKHLVPPEFEWLRDALLQDGVQNWIEWHLALYRTLEQLGIRFLCSGGQFELMDSAGKRLYFSVDHTNAAEHVLMKILFPLNQ